MLKEVQALEHKLQVHRVEQTPANMEELGHRRQLEDQALCLLKTFKAFNNLVLKHLYIRVLVQQEQVPVVTV
jgi:hypothetical protein